MEAAIDKGVIVGCDEKLEWILPWWWKHYSQHNSYPVAFADFGMSEKALRWCSEKGFVLPIPHIQPQETISEEKKRVWEGQYGDVVWRSRSSWFKKPSALLASPFSYSLYLDLDCEIRGSLEPLFCCLSFLIEIAIVKEPEEIHACHRNIGLLQENESLYNSGVIAYKKGSPIIEKWYDLALNHSEEFIGDQHALSRAIFLHEPVLFELPSIFNWLRNLGPNPDALIVHYFGPSGKKEILDQL